MIIFSYIVLASVILTLLGLIIEVIIHGSSNPDGSGE